MMVLGLGLALYVLDAVSAASDREPSTPTPHVIDPIDTCGVINDWGTFSFPEKAYFVSEFAKQKLREWGFEPVPVVATTTSSGYAAEYDPLGGVIYFDGAYVENEHVITVLAIAIHEAWHAAQNQALWAVQGIDVYEAMKREEKGIQDIDTKLDSLRGELECSADHMVDVEVINVLDQCGWDLLPPRSGSRPSRCSE